MKIKHSGETTLRSNFVIKRRSVNAMNVSNLDLRAAIMHNMHGSSKEDVRHTIVDAISSREEKTLPGLGVLFELLWQGSDDQAKDNMINAIHQQVQ
jgi:small acid-soluble spore protein I (minor)